MAEYNFKQLLDLERIRSLLQVHHKITGVFSGILDPEQNILVGEGWEDICARFHRVHPVTCARCLENDALIAHSVHDTGGEYLESKCPNGLRDIAIPIIIDNRMLATFFLGQFFYDDEEIDESFFRAQAKECGFNEEAYINALKKVPVFNREQIRNHLDFCRDLVHILAENGLKTLKLMREVKERKKAEAEVWKLNANLEQRVEERTSELQQALAFAEGVINAIPDPLFEIDGDGTYMNVWADGKFLSRPKEQLLGKNLRDILSPEVLEIALRTMKEVDQHGFSRGNVYRLKLRDGDHWFELSASKKEPEGTYLALTRDITGRMDREKKIRLLEMALDATEETIWLFDIKDNGRLVYVNEGASRMLGYTREELLEKGVIGNIDREYTWEDTAKNLEILFREKYTTFERVHTAKDGRKIPVAISNALFETDESAYVLATARDITMLREAQAQTKYLARHDLLTGLPNRQTMKERTDNAIAAARRRSEKVALLFIDLDNFKAVNDSLGHATGDRFLQKVSQRLLSCVREIDTVGRHGGDEFVITLSAVKNADEVMAFVSRFFREFEQAVRIDKYKFFVSISMGIALYPDDGESFDALLKRADTAMYAAKDEGRNTYSFFSNRMNRSILEHLQMHGDLKKAMAAKEFRLYYQPQIDIASGMITGAEALLRWQHPGRGMIPPMQFIPVAESSGMIIPMGKWIIEEACRQGASWHAQGMELSVAVNISAVQFRRGDLVETVRHALDISGLGAHYLELELTESVIMHNTDESLNAVRQLKNLGVRLSIDDFGTGYSSLAYLKRFAVNKLKIDRSFVRDIVHDDDDAAIVRAIIHMAKSLGVATVAEGVEDLNTMEILQCLKCDTVQGFLFSPPLNKTDFEEFYAQRTPKLFAEIKKLQHETLLRAQA